MAVEMETFLDYALQVGASDLILAEGLVPAVRLSKQVRAIPEAPRLEYGDLELLTGVLAGESGCFRGGPWCGCEWRVRYSREAFGKMASFRPMVAECPDFISMGVPEPVLSLLGLGAGLVVFAGNVGSGKTTTASAYVSSLCRKRLCRARFLDSVPEYPIQTGESIVHYRRPKVTLEQELFQGLCSGTDLFWLGDIASGSLLPLLHATEAGSLVVGCMTAGNAVGVLDFLLAGEPAEREALSRTLLASNLKAVVSQHLFPASGGKGIVCAWEVLYNNQAVASLIRSGEHYKIPQLIRTSASDGMLSLDDSLSILVRDHSLTKEDARKYALDESRLV